MSYDSNNIFAKILRGDIPCKKVYEDNYSLAFHDIQPKAPVHVLVIPKGSYINYADFAANAPDSEISGFVKAVSKVAEKLGVENEGYRLIVNSGLNGGQEVSHYHIHILGGRVLGAMVAKAG